MAVIDVGAGATDRASSFALSTERTLIDGNNAANGDGMLDTFEIWVLTADAIGIKMGTFYGSSISWTSRDVETIGTVAYGSKQTFTGKNCDVQTGDLLGLHNDTTASSALERSTTGFNNVLYAGGDNFGDGAHNYTIADGDAFSIYATGATAAAGNPYYYYLNQ